MRVLRREDYEKMAKEAVAKMVNDSVPLNRSLVKIADSMGLNPDQIKALVQVANTLAHLDLFDRKSDGDKIVNFTPADPDQVLRDVVTSDGDSCCSSSGSSGSADKLQDFFGDFSSDPAPTDSSALANVGQVLNEATNDPTPRRHQIMIIKIRKVAEELKQKKLAALHQYGVERDKLASEFAKLYGPKFEEFEKDAIDVHGADIVPILSELRHELRMPRIKVAVFEKTARLVDSDTAEMQKFGRMKAFLEEVTACDAGLELLKREVGGVL